MFNMHLRIERREKEEDGGREDGREGRKEN